MADHNLCHNEGTPPDIWTGIVGADVDQGVKVCVGDFTYIVGSDGTTVRVLQCDESGAPANCDPLVDSTGGGVELGHPGPACAGVTVFVNGEPSSPFEVGVCEPA